MQEYKMTMNKRGACVRAHALTHTHTYIYIYIYNVMMLQGKEKWEMGNGHSYKEANPFPYNLPTYPKGFIIIIIFFLNEGKE